LSKITLYGRRGWGSAIVEAQLEWLGLDYTYEAVGDLLRSAEARRSLAPVNPLAQVPTLVLPNGQILTESAAITLYLADMTGHDELVPPPGSVGRPDFLRWLIFLVANVYPTYTYADEPNRFVPYGGKGRLSGNGRRLRSAALRHPRGDGAHTVVSRRTLLGTRHLCSGHDPLAAAPQMVCREHATTSFDRDAGGRDPAAASRLVAQFHRGRVVNPALVPDPAAGGHERCDDGSD
jgi:glutathione S-transferase